ncbi:MAG: hypothetical protein ABIT01_11850 [Thermoanaerobaculia bacterium]
MKATHSRLLATGFLFVSIHAAPPLQAEAVNLITNGTFDTSVDGWRNRNPEVNSIEWSSVDSRGSILSGSGLAGNGATSANSSAFISQCVAVSPNTSYYLSGKTRRPAGQDRTGNHGIILFAYAQESCAGDAIGAEQLSSTNETERWTSLPFTTYLTPAGTKSIDTILFIGKTEAGGKLVYAFDSVALVASTPATLTIPTSASIHGNNDAFFHSDLWVMNRAYAGTQTITARYRCFTGQSCASTTKTFALDPRASTLYADVVGTLFQAPETAGAIELSYDSALGEVSATSRVYTPSQPLPTSGSAIPASSASDARARTLFLGLGASGGDLSAGFRSNAGAYNPGATEVPVTFTLHSATGAVLGNPLTRTWGPNEAFQISNIFGAVGASSDVTTNAYLVVTSTTPIFAFVTVIDNQSGDSIYVAPNRDEAP